MHQFAKIALAKIQTYTYYLLITAAMKTYLNQESSYYQVLLKWL